MKLYIIGNGFDRGHDLPTSYWDFRNYLLKNHPEFLYDFEENYNIYPSMTDEEKSKILWKDFEHNLANIKEDEIVSDAVSIDMDLESGPVGIEDTLYYYFQKEYKYINKLSKYLKQWVENICIRDAQPKSSKIIDDAYYLVFNYTSVLEDVYDISTSHIVHIHGSLNNYDIEPVIGHGNIARIEQLAQKRYEAELIFDEAQLAIYKVLDDYYRETYKDTNRYMHQLSKIPFEKIDEIVVIGHSIAEVDLPYFSAIDSLTNHELKWTVFYFNFNEERDLLENLIKGGISQNRIKIHHSADFYDL